MLRQPEIGQISEYQPFRQRLNFFNESFKLLAFWKKFAETVQKLCCSVKMFFHLGTWLCEIVLVIGNTITTLEKTWRKPYLKTILILQIQITTQILRARKNYHAEVPRYEIFRCHALVLIRLMVMGKKAEAKIFPNSE